MVECGLESLDNESDESFLRILARVGPLSKETCQRLEQIADRIQNDTVTAENVNWLPAWSGDEDYLSPNMLDK